MDFESFQVLKVRGLKVWFDCFLIFSVEKLGNEHCAKPEWIDIKDTAIVIPAVKEEGCQVACNQVWQAR